MSKYIKVLLVFIISIFSLSVIDNVSAKDYSINFYEFYGATCPHCEELNEWLENTLAKDKDYNYKYKLVRYEVWSDQTNSTLMLNVGKYLGVEVRGVPFMVIGDESLSGFSATASPDQIKSLIDKAYKANKDGKYKDVVAEVNDGKTNTDDSKKTSKNDKKKNDFAGYIIAGGIAILVIGIIIFRSKNSYIEEETEVEVTEKVEEPVKEAEEEKVVEKKKSTAKKSTTKKSSTKKKSIKKSKK